ncbi:MAG: immunity 53 family protein [Flavobacteriales bacterium]|nr:immunity 53 family protein [Flavobacteriales bacterium]
MEPLQRLQLWYKNQCDGDWEHDFGIKINTLDNPGWSLTIDLQLTSLEGFEFEEQKEVSEFDWYHVKVDHWQYVAYGDPSKLTFLITYFLDELVPKYSDPNFEYEVLVPLYGGPIDIWTIGHARMKNENEFELVKIESPDSMTMLSTNLDNVESWIKDFEKFELRNKAGDIVDTELVETFQGTRLGIKKN